MKVFISSTYDDLKEYRAAAIEVVNDFQCVVLAMEHLKSRPQKPKKVCDKEVMGCNIFVGIYAHRYGFTPKGEEKSITQLEYELAKKEGKDCLCFIVDREHPWKRSFIEFEKENELNALLKKIKDEKTISYFTTIDDFKAKLTVSLSKVIEKKSKITEKEPLARQPYTPHPYPLPKNFTGREEEKDLLSNWLNEEKEQVLVIEAIGGMGKSALSWVWLQELLNSSPELDGIFWWSFYEASFETFLHKLACYVLGKTEYREKGLLSIDLENLYNDLCNSRFLLVLDGLERILRGYSGMTAMYIKEEELRGGKSKETKGERQKRQAVHPKAERFLRHLTAGNSKTLITTRLMPTALEELAGVKHIFLKGLSPIDAVDFMRKEGLQGIQAEMVEAGKVYDYHPLMIKLLTTAIKKSRKKDIKDAYKLKLINQEKPKKILTTTFNLLTKKEKKVASTIAVFRNAFTFESAKALFSKEDKDKEQLWEILQELCSLGFLSYEEKEKTFDFHPILRSFLYDKLKERKAVHERAADYFKELPKKEKIITLDDLSPVIELYHHLVRAKNYDEAFMLFSNKIAISTYEKLSAYNLIIELLREFFPKGEAQIPCLKNDSDKGWTFNTLAISYANSGQPDASAPLYFQGIKITEKQFKENIAIGLFNVASMSQIHIGRLSAAIAHLLKSISLFQEIKSETAQATAQRELGLALAFKGQARAENFLNDSLEIIRKQTSLDKSNANWEKKNPNHELSVVYVYWSLFSLMQARLKKVQLIEKNDISKHISEALKQAKQALTFAKKASKTQHPYTLDFLRAYWLLGESLLQYRQSKIVLDNHFEINFYDETFQDDRETLKVKKGQESGAAKRCLVEALHLCRKVNAVAFEAYVLLGLARLEWVETRKISENIEKNLKEVNNIAKRSNYRLELADLHLQCAQMLLVQKEKDKLLGFSAREHLQKAKDYSLDMSALADLYPSEDPHFYDGIPEYEMLKKGMTKEERIQNGYWVAYRIAEELEKKL